jgi:dTDP-glucose 4,6-dehydratase
VYGDGGNVRDWLFVGDHCGALMKIAEQGEVGGTFAIGGDSERTNLEVVRAICGILDDISPRTDGGRYEELITFVRDRPGHDRRYAMDASKLKSSLGWKPSRTFEEGLRETVKWYIDNREWTDGILSGNYRLSRIGLGEKD